MAEKVTVTVPMAAPSMASDVSERAATWRTVLLSVLCGAVIAAVWSFELVDGVIGDNVANALLGTHAKAVSLSDGPALFGLAFSFVAGLAGTFTACNCVVFSCIAPLTTARTRASLIWRSGAWRRGWWR